jgi:hypothetical protein
MMAVSVYWTGAARPRKFAGSWKARGPLRVPKTGVAKTRAAQARSADDERHASASVMCPTSSRLSRQRKRCGPETFLGESNINRFWIGLPAARTRPHGHSKISCRCDWLPSRKFVASPFLIRMVAGQLEPIEEQALRLQRVDLNLGEGRYIAPLPESSIRASEDLRCPTVRGRCRCRLRRWFVS